MTDTANPERILFASTAQAFLEKEGSLSRVRELHAAGKTFEPVWWQRAAELGWSSMLVPEELGGGSVSGDGVGDLALIAELIGRTVAPGPLHPVNTVLAGLVDAAAGSDSAETHSALIESLVRGELIASWAVYEPRRGWTPLETTVTATPTVDGYRIDGVKDRVEAGPESDVFLVVARHGDELRQYLASPSRPSSRSTW
jgi:alkylation response protein AidB-like acyl-CoA dehydrogenase